MPTPTRTQILGDAIVSTVDTWVKKTPADVVFEGNLLFGSLWGADRMDGAIESAKMRIPGVPKGNVQRISGRELWLPYVTGRSTNFTPFRGTQTFNTNLDDGLAVQRESYRYYTDATGIAKTEKWENMGPEAVISRLQTRLQRVFRTMSEGIEIDLNDDGDGLTNAGNNEHLRIAGIRHIIPRDPTTGTVWSLDRATFTHQRSQTSGDVANSFANAGMDEMRDMFSAVSGNGGVDKPSAIVTTEALFNAYCRELEDKHQVVNAGVADLGFPAASYKGLPLTYSDLTTAGEMRFLNLKYWHLFMPPGADFTSETTAGMVALNQAIEVFTRVYLGIQWGCEQYKRQGLIWGFTDV